MRKLSILILVIISQQCHKQDDYSTTLSARLKELKALRIFDNSVVVYPDSLMFDGLEHWKTDHAYYKDDIVTTTGKMYITIVDSCVGKYPPTSPKEWLLGATNYHPYQYLRDTAGTTDLKELLNDSNPYIRVYAFGALAH